MIAALADYFIYYGKRQRHEKRGEETKEGKSSKEIKVRWPKDHRTF